MTRYEKKNKNLDKSLQDLVNRIGVSKEVNSSPKLDELEQVDEQIITENSITHNNPMTNNKQLFINYDDKNQDKNNISNIDFLPDHSGLNLLQIDSSPFAINNKNSDDNLNINYKKQKQVNTNSNVDDNQRKSILNKLSKNTKEILEEVELDLSNQYELKKINTQHSINSIISMKSISSSQSESVVKKSQISEKTIKGLDSSEVTCLPDKNQKRIELNKEINETNNINNLNITKNINAICDEPIGQISLFQSRSKQFQNREIEIEAIKTKYKMLSNDNVSSELKSVKTCGKAIDIIISAIVVFNVCVALYENYDFTTKRNNPFKEANAGDEINTTLKYIEIGCSVLLIIFMFVRYHVFLMQLRKEGMACQNDNFCTTGLWKGLLLESFIMAFFTPFGKDSDNYFFTGEMLDGVYVYPLDSLSTFLICFKSYYVFRLFMIFSKWNSEETLNIAKENKITVGVLFALKSSIKQHPFMFLIVSMAVSLGFCGFLVKVFEQGYTANASPTAGGTQKGGNPDFEAYLDSFWLIVITMLTVGYGDLFPKTHLGRIVIIYTTLAGMVIISFLIVSLSNWTDLTPEEKKSFVLIQRREAIEIMNTEAKAFIRMNMKLFYLRNQKVSRQNR